MAQHPHEIKAFFERKVSEAKLTLEKNLKERDKLLMKQSLEQLEGLKELIKALSRVSGTVTFDAGTVEMVNRLITEAERNVFMLSPHHEDEKERFVHILDNYKQKLRELVRLK
ncbi:hypothetical protein COT72_00740 [archaeon CG10_big_fil_rev_8_21_14_0_10_43_11]|nr:MAG: hypothetical protein COT72_00740 [archaeon CG10_big_fil_rev_8_21_14_0_10_43_11]